MAIQEALEKFGLTINEIKAYMAVINLGSSSAGNVAKETNLHRRPTYDALDRLVSKGLISYTIKEGKKSFQAADPERLLEIAKQREREIEQVLPELKEKYKSTKVKIFAEIYEGNEGIKTVMEDILLEGKEWLTLGSTGIVPKSFSLYLEKFAGRREKLKIKRKILVANDERGRQYYKILKKQKLIEVKFLPVHIQNPQTIWIYSNKVLIMVTSEEHPVMFLIENEKIANSYRDYFNLIWNQVKKKY